MKKFFSILYVILLLLILSSCDSKNSNYIDLSVIYESIDNIEELEQYYEIDGLYLKNSESSTTSYLGVNYVQSLNFDSDGLYMIEFKTSEDALKSKNYIKKNNKKYCYSVYENILFFDYFPCYLLLNNYIEKDDVVFSKDLKTLVLFSKNVKSYSLPEGIESISCGAFQDSNIEDIKFNEELKRINGFAFGSCKKLEHIKFKNNVEYIGSQAFDDCVQLKTIYVPPRVKYIDPNAFNYGNVFIDEYELPGEWSMYFCSDHNYYNKPNFKFFSKYYLKGEWEFDENGIPKVITISEE